MAINVKELRIGNLIYAGNMNEVRWGTYKQNIRQVTLLTLDIDDEYMEYITHVEPGVGHVEPRKHNNEVDDLCRNIEPILLTEEWLKGISPKMKRFERQGNGYDYKPGYLTYEGCDYILNEDIFIRKNIFRYPSNGKLIEEDEGFKFMHGEPGDARHIRNIEYVHQLQNLYFALTGEELQIKEV